MSNLNEKPKLNIIKLKPQNEIETELLKNDMLSLLDSIKKDVTDGKIKGLGFFGITDGGSVYTAYSRYVAMCPVFSLGAVEVLKDRIKLSLVNEQMGGK